MTDIFKQLFRVSSLLWLAGILAVGACADPEEIDRVQPDLLEKAALTDGEYYALTTVVRAPYASSDYFPGLQGTLLRGVWEIEKDFLYFYRTYEFVEGVEAQGLRDDADKPLLDADGNPVTYQKTLDDGTVVTATRYVYRSAPQLRFPILGHYDVRRTYNPMTGEPTNVRVEDASEKFWFERDWMRVNFGVNDNLNHAVMWPTHSASISTSGQTSVAQVNIYEGEEGPEDIKLRVEDDGAYFDFVVRGFSTAPRTFLSGWGFVPTCLFFPWYTGAYYECDEEEIHVRASFMKVPQDNSYKPMQFDDHLLNKFGFYRSSRIKHDQFYGRTFTDALRYIRRFRVWKEYVTDASGKLDYAQMEPNPIVYYLSEDFPRELLPGALDLADQWNEPFMEVVETRMNKEYEGRMFVLCENNSAELDAVLAANPDALTAETDPRWCQDMDKVKRMGDLRYNLLVSVNDPVQYGLYGYGPMHSDPITGETIHANAFNYTANMRLGARNAVDMIEYAAGVQNFRDITQARHIKTSVKADKLAGTQGAPRSFAGADVAQLQHMADLVVSPEVSAELTHVGFDEVDTNMAAARMNRLLQTDEFDHLWLNADMAAIAGLPVTELDADLTQVTGSDFLSSIVHPARMGDEGQLKWQLESDMLHGQAAVCMGDHFDDSFRGLALEYKDSYDDAICTSLKAEMDNGADYVFDFEAFKEPGADCSAGADACGENQVCQFLDQGEVSGSYCMTPCSAGALLQQLRDELRRVNQISQFEYWDPNALYTDTKDARVLASQLAARKIIEARREEVFLELYDRIWSTVAMHEVGHNLGLRHNFAGSTDALNFFPEYWDLKGGDDGGTWTPHNLWESDTESQVVNRMREFQSTSIMEYTSAFNARFQGLGSYDRAAILYGYGNLVEVFKSPPAYGDWERYLADPSDTNPDQFSLSQRREQPLARALRKVHHTNLPAMFGSVANIYEREVVDAEAVANLDKPCDQHDNPYDDTVCGEAGSFCQPFPSGFFCTKPDMVEVPMRFCSDEYNWTSPTCQTWDEGVDSFEIINNSIADYEAYWPFRAYQRDNALFSPSTGYWRRVLYDMYGWRKHFEHWAFNYARYNKRDWWETRFGVPWHQDPNGGLGQTISMMALFEHLANIFGRPNDAYYGFNQERAIYEPVIDNGRNTYCNVFQIREDQGARPMYPSYDFSGYMYTPARAGTFYDRLGAIMYMTYPYSMFTVGVDKSYDIKRFRMNFASVWPQRMQNILSGIIAGEPDLFGWCIEHEGTETPSDVNICTEDPVRVKPRMWFGTESELDAHYANCKPLNPEPEYSFPTTQYRLPALAAIYGYGWMSYTFDRSFIDRNRVWLKGDGSDITIPDGFETIEYTDAFSGKTYVASYDPSEEDPYSAVSARDAIPSPDESGVLGHSYWSAARLLALANHELATTFGGNLSELGSGYQYSVLQQTIGRLEILRGLYRAFDFGF
ncbi:MAG: hypothetical protein CSA24_01905 [Deltaproteobacteria bacterium]|nr:MAG: hypothetical protein CSA24_01905 [Deltaproteobacteria bacterium]